MRKLAVVAWMLSPWVIGGCFNDPADPKTWIKKLEDVREQKEAVRQLVKLKDKQAVAPLIALYNKTHDHDHLQAIASFDDPQAVPTLIEALDYTEESFDSASVAATALGDIGDKSAVEPLIKAVLKPLPIKTRANVVKLESMKSLAKIKDPRAVDTLVKVLTTPADEQDFFLNKVAAKSLGEFADPKAVPALVRGLFMTGRGAGIYQECRSALIAIGEPSVDKLVEAMQHRYPELEADAKKYEFVPGIIIQKTGFLLGDLHAKKAVPALVEELDKKDEGLAAGEGKGVPAHQGTIIALGLIGDTSVRPKLEAIVGDSKRHKKERLAAAEALNLLGDPASLPALLSLAKTKFINGTTIDGEAGELAMGGATAYSRLAGPDANPGFQKIPDEIVDANEAFKAAETRLAVAKECKQDVACLEKYLEDASSPKAEKAAFALSRMGKPGLSALLKHIGARDPAARMTILFAIGRLGDKGCTECLEALNKQIATDEGKPPLLPLLQEMRATRAVLAH